MTQDRLLDEPYDYHDQYYSINTGVHRKGGVKLVTPTLTHHLGLWYPPVSSTHGSQLSVTRFGPRVDAYVRAHFSALRTCDGFESNFSFTIANDEVIGLFGDAYRRMPNGTFEPFDARIEPVHFGLKDALDSDSRILFMKARWHGLDVVVRCEFRSEYATITRFVTLVERGALQASTAALGPALDLLVKLGESKACSEHEIGGSHAFLYRNVWEALDLELFRCTKIFRSHDENSRCRIFADFRGIVVSAGDDGSAGTISLEAPGTNDKSLPDGWADQQLIRTMWPFLTVRDGLDLAHREFTASLMLNQRAVYITALGPQPLADAGPQCAPLQYFLVARPVSDWQIGALVDRLHFMGTVRLAALMELKALREAGANLRDMEHAAEMARRAIDANEPATARDHYQRAMVLIAHKDASGNPIFWAGLQFRVERSRYYVERFNEFVAFLGIDPIDGYQRYHHFVRARLGGVYDYINRLGHRQERAVRSAESIFQLISLREAAETNKQIAEANRQSTEANRLSAAANERNLKISRTIEKLQTKAEFALLAVIVPHYAIGIVNDVRDRFKESDHTIFRWDVAILLVGTIFAMVSVWNFAVDRRGDADGREYLRKTVGKYWLLALVSAIVVFFVVTGYVVDLAGAIRNALPSPL